MAFRSWKAKNEEQESTPKPNDNQYYSPLVVSGFNLFLFWSLRYSTLFYSKCIWNFYSWSSKLLFTLRIKNKTKGGVDNTNIPNYVYRWTEREIIKLLKSYRPDLKHKIFFNYGYQIKFTKSKILKFLFDIFFFIFTK